MNIQEINDVRGFRVPLSFEDNKYVDIYVTPTEDEGRGINGYVLDHMVMESGYGLDPDEDQEIIIMIAREVDLSYDPFEETDGEEDPDPLGIILKSLPL